MNTLDQAVNHHKAGRVREAEALYSQVLAHDPKNPVALHLMGVVQHQKGDAFKAVQMIGQAVRVRPDYLDAHMNLGQVQRGLNQLDAAAASFEAALKVEPAHASAHFQLAITRHMQGRGADAVVHYRHAVEAEPGLFEAWVNLAVTCKELDRLDEAVQAYEQALELRPDFAEIHSNLGVVLKDLNRPGEAVACFEKAVRLKPDFGEAWRNLAAAQYELGLLDVAGDTMDTVLTHLGQEAGPYVLLGDIRKDQGRFDAARDAYARALKIEPQNVDVLVALGELNRELGDMAEAQERFRQALAVDPACGGAYLNLANTAKGGLGEDDLHAIEKVLEAGELSDKQRIDLHYAAGKGHGDARAFDPAFAHYRNGAALKHAEMKFDISAAEAGLKDIARAFTPDLFAKLAGRGLSGPAPMFIVSMPRAGSSLLEQMLACHPDVAGGGELAAMHNIVQAETVRLGAPHPAFMTAITAKGLKRIGQAYVDAVMAAVTPRRLTDKMPGNFRYVGLISLALPDAKLIHIRRNPVDTCLSCFTSLFTHAQGFTYDLEVLGRYYQAYRGLMDHWRAVLPEGRMLEVDYEDLVAEPEAELRKVLAHCGLPWHAACLDFHQSKRPVQTASASQVRQPLYKSSVERWRAYEKHLGPLLKALGPYVPT